jgi:hypothetical protein
LTGAATAGVTNLSSEIAEILTLRAAHGSNDQNLWMALGLVT